MEALPCGKEGVRRLMKGLRFNDLSDCEHEQGHPEEF